MRKDKQEWLEEKCTEVEEMNRRHNTSGVYKTIKEITGKRGMRQMGIKDKDGKTLTDGEQVKATGVFCVVPICGLAAFPIR